MDHKSDSHTGVQQSQISSSSSRAMNQEGDCSSISGQLQALNKQQKIPFTSHSAADVNSSGSTLKSQPHDSQMTSGPNCQEQNSVDDPIKKHRYIVPDNCQVYKMEDYKKQSKSHSSTPQVEHMMPMNPVSPSLSPQLSSQNSSDNSPAGVKARTPRKRRPADQKKRQKKSLQALGSSPPLPSKKQKVSGDFSDQSTPLLNDIVNLQRADAEKPMHLKHITSDIGHQIKRLNSEAKEEWEKNHVEDEKVQTLDEPEGTGVHGEKDKNEGQENAVKMRTAAAANVAVRAAVGGEDVLSKWKLMAEQARNKRDEGTSRKDNPETEKRGPLNPPISGKLDIIA
ncbi:Transcription initiation factor TFIID component TAF4 [Corchorus olitorius]|uniref:Transcription initiation factor TFIID component TAF4 n=1 Tax=Corchorus olitorius TaxID=93759 RepID=A0A1R3JZT7_9ROSI|nr:Transcription initiation factor TFIID component TAF4 [Corchorus olitorius]